MELKFEVYAKIKKPIAEVFDAVYNPKKLAGYFTTGGASGPLDEGKTVMWDFHDFPGAFPVVVKQSVKTKKSSSSGTGTRASSQKSSWLLKLWTRILRKSRSKNPAGERSTIIL
jgi:hypothetical protein